jgi:hypothetical protein
VEIVLFKQLLLCQFCDEDGSEQFSHAQDEECVEMHQL